MAIGKLAAEFSAGDKGLQDELAGIESALKSSGLSASAFAKRFNEALDGAEKSAGSLMPILEKLQTKIAILKTAMKFETDPAALKAMGKELKGLEVQMLNLTGKTYQAHQRGTRELQQEYHHTASAIFALSMLMGVFSSSTDTATGKTKVLKDSMDKGVQAAMGMSFGLMMLGERFSKFIGPVGIIVGVITAIATAVHASNEEMKKATEEGLKGFAESFGKLSPEKQQIFLQDIKARRQAIQKEQDSLQELVQTITPTGELIITTELKHGMEGVNDKLEKKKSILAEILKEYEHEAEKRREIDELTRLGADRLLETGTALQKLNEQELRFKKELATGLMFGVGPELTPEQMKAVADELLKIGRERDKLLKTSEQRAKESIDLGKLEYEQGLRTAGSYVNLLKTKRGVFALTKDQLAVDKEIQAVYASRAAFEEQKYQTEEDKIVRGFEARKHLDEITQQANIDAIDNKWGKERAAATAEHKKRLQQISDEGYASGNIDNAKPAIDAEDRRFRTQTMQILREEQAQMFDDILQGASSVASAMQSAFGGAGDSLIGKLGQAFQIAIQIARAIQAANAPNAGPGAGLGVLGSVLGIFGLFGGFARGGFTGAGQRNQPAGVVHAGEVVFEKPLVDTYGAMLLQLRSQMQRGFSSGGFTGGGGAPGMGRGEFMMNGTLDMINGETKLRVWMPGYERWNSKKTP